MLIEKFPISNDEAAVYGGFILSGGFFCRTFETLETDETIENTLNKINDFLVQNGYEKIELNELDDEYECEKGPVSISKHGYMEELVLIVKQIK